MDVSGNFGKGIKDGGGYDLSEIERAEEALDSGQTNTKGMEEVEPMYIEVIPDSIVVRTEEYEARIVVIDYDENDNIVGVELL